MKVTPCPSSSATSNSTEMSGSVAVPVTTTLVVGSWPTVSSDVASAPSSPGPSSDHCTESATMASAVRAWQNQVLPGMVVADGGLVSTRPQATAAAPCASTSRLTGATRSTISLTRRSAKGSRGSIRDWAVA